MCVCVCADDGECWFCCSDSLEAHLEVLLEVLGQWVQRVEIRGKVYIKRVDKMMDMKTLADIIRQKEKELEHA